MKAVILSAGVGSRLHPYSINFPKCLVKVGEDEMLKWQLKSLTFFNFKEIIIVVGYKSKMVRDFVEKNFPGENIRFVENSKYLTTSNLYSLKLGLSYVNNKKVLILNGDLVFNRKIISLFLNSGYENSVAVVNRVCDEEDMKVRITPAQKTDSFNYNRITEISKTISLQDSDGQALGIYKIKDTQLLKKLLNQIEESNYFNEAINRMTNIVPIYAVDITRFPSIEIDFPEDLKKANELFKTKDI